MTEIEQAKECLERAAREPERMGMEAAMTAVAHALIAIAEELEKNSRHDTRSDFERYGVQEFKVDP